MEMDLGYPVEISGIIIWRIITKKFTSFITDSTIILIRF